MLLNAPFRRNQLGLNILEALRAIGPVLHPSLAGMWDAALPKLAAIVDSMWPRTCTNARTHTRAHLHSYANTHTHTHTHQNVV